MQGPKNSIPLKMLGRRLKLLRESKKESLAEVSGAIEIDIDTLERIEKGEECPAEDILMLLISHFGLHDNDAVQLWDWAGYSVEEEPKPRQTSGAAETMLKQAVVLFAMDTRVLYSDNLIVSGDQNGIVLNFLQPGPQAQAFPAARIGMSYEQAERVLHAIEQALLQRKYLPNQRLLPPGSTHFTE